MSDYFTLERGVRQGDPLSPYLFVVAIKSLALTIRENPPIRGIMIGKEETKLLQYADDMTAVLCDINSTPVSTLVQESADQHLPLFEKKKNFN